MAIDSICQTQVATIEKGANLAQASTAMQSQHVGSLVVTENFNGKRIPSGIITDRDIALALGSTPKARELAVSQIMRSQPLTVSRKEGVFETIVKMRENGIKRMPVVDTDGSLYGIVCADDLLSLVADELSQIARVTEVQVNKEKGVSKPVERTVHT